MAEGARLEIVCAERYRGFDSLPLRNFEGSIPLAQASRPRCLSLREPLRDGFMVPGDADTVNPARSGRKQR